MADNSFVIGVDSSTTATKAIAFARDGSALAEGRCANQMSNPAPLRYEQDPVDWWEALASALRELGKNIDLAGTQALAISNQRETVAFLDDQGKAVRPAIVWLDERAKNTFMSFADEVGQDEIHRLTGKPADITPVCYRLAWMRDNEPDAYARTSSFCDVAAYLTYRMTGKIASSWASADPLGYYDIGAKQWAKPVLDKLGITPDRLPAAEAPGSVHGKLTEQVAQETGLPDGLPIAAGGGDGQCAAMGGGAVLPGVAYANLGTAVTVGLWQQDYEHDRGWRTMTSATGEGYLAEGVLRSGTFLVNWLVCDIFGMDGSPEDLAKLTSQAAELEPGCADLMLMPYWLGVMNPHWNNADRGAIIGVSAEHKRHHLFRAILEGIALEQSMYISLFEQRTGTEVHTINLVGGGAQSDLWAQIMADALGKKCCRLATVEASALGAAMAAAVGAGWYASGTKAALAMAGQSAAVFKPQSKGQQAYGELLERYRKIYPATQQITGAAN